MASNVFDQANGASKTGEKVKKVNLKKKNEKKDVDETLAAIHGNVKMLRQMVDDIDMATGGKLPNPGFTQDHTGIFRKQ